MTSSARSLGKAPCIARITDLSRNFGIDLELSSSRAYALKVSDPAILCCGDEVLTFCTRLPPAVASREY